uniref:Uncharacterized protein n=1 Tax=Gracilaria salicornia TaxID=172968 RepID=W8DW06_9FLOR|nr:hypothetical protein [Gracilaria salicornia]AHH24631.1 hypothetical protein [Gracilaria salicornia]UAD87596.1 hypothetical protein [Gracilaria salicornia]
MNLIENIVLHRYVYSPKNWLHNLKPHYKTYSLFIYLCIIQYSHSKYIAISICLYFMLTLHFKNINNYYTKILLYILFILHILVYTICLSIESQFYTYIISYIHYAIIHIYNKNILYLRILLLLIHYFLSINMMFMTTTYEDIIFSFLELFKKYESNTTNRIIFISTFASQVLENLGLKIKHILFSIKMKQITKLFRVKYYIYLILKFIQDIYSDIYRVSTVLYTRELNNRLLYITNIHE